MKLTREALIQYFRDGIRPTGPLLVGTEYEKFLLSKETGQPLTYEGNLGIRNVLSKLASGRGWSPVLESGNIIALKKSGASISLEPGGLFELSGAPFSSIEETNKELEEHLADLRWLESEFPNLDVVWLGFQPHARREDISWMPKGRYKVMREYLPTRGELGLDMMKRTATVQANLDYTSEEDAALKMFAASWLGPLITALFGNSSRVEGKDSGFHSYRQHVWSDVDSDRCGDPECVLNPGSKGLFAAYTDWACNIPLFFIYRNGEYLPCHHLTFGDWMRVGWQGVYPSMDDWELHLSTLFPNVRLKQYIEVRSADCCKPELIASLPAFWASVLYSPDALRSVQTRFEEFGVSDLREGYRVACRDGLAGNWMGQTIRQHLEAIFDVLKHDPGRFDSSLFDFESTLEPLAKLEQRLNPPIS